MVEKVVCYCLSRKFIDQKDLPPVQDQLIYYTLAIGHHIGVLDCLEKVLETDRQDYISFAEKLSKGGKSKLLGVLKYGEIEINRGHTDSLKQAIDESLALFNERERHQAVRWRQLLQLIDKNPNIYLVVKTECPD